jgi:hypothetical protein
MQIVLVHALCVETSYHRCGIDATFQVRQEPPSVKLSMKSYKRLQNRQKRPGLRSKWRLLRLWRQRKVETGDVRTAVASRRYLDAPVWSPSLRSHVVQGARRHIRRQHEIVDWSLPPAV